MLIQIFTTVSLDEAAVSSYRNLPILTIKYDLTHHFIEIL